VASGTGRPPPPPAPGMSSEEERQVHRASRTLTGTRMITGQASEDLRLFWNRISAPFPLPLLLWENSAKAGPHVWMHRNEKQYQKGSQVREEQDGLSSGTDQ